MKYIAMIFLMFITVLCKAGPISYQCVFLQEYKLDDQGKLLAVAESQLVGENFSVDRKTGNAITPVHSVWPHAESKITVLANGNNENSFVATYQSKAAKNGVFLSSLRIEEFNPEINKPFIVLANYYVYTGTCK